MTMDRAMPDWHDRKEDLRIKAKEFLVFDLIGQIGSKEGCNRSY